MALQVASLFGVLNLRDNMTPGLDSALNRAQGLGNQMTSIGNRITGIGAGVTAVTAPVGAYFMSSINSARQFESNLLNIQAVTGNTSDEMDLLAGNLQAIGRNSRQGENEISSAFYTIASAVGDASTHMDILQSSITLADAGQADLLTSTNAVIGAMNSYNLNAEDAGFVSDVLTRSVGMGVGTMNDFAGQMNNNASIANTLGIGYDDLAAQTSFLTTQNRTVGQATTQLMGIMTAFLNPNTAMTEALQQMGYQSGSAAIESLGLEGALQLMYDTLGSTDAMTSALGSQEALQGSIGLLSGGYEDFRTRFGEGMEGLAEGTAAVQNQNAAYDTMMSKLQGVSNTIGGILNPMIQTFINQHVNPALDRITAWMTANPQLTATIVTVAGALVIAGPVLAGFGMLISGAGTAVAALKGGLAFLLGPMGLVILAIGGIVAWLNSRDGGLIGSLQEAATVARQLGFIFIFHVNGAIRTAQMLLTIAIVKLNQAITTAQQIAAITGNTLDRAGTTAGQIGFLIQNPVATFNALTGNNVDGQRAAGGPVTAGRTYLVGERGPELFSPSRSGSISSNRDTAAMMSGAGGDTFNFYGDIVTPDGEDFMTQLEERRRRRS
ncbi:MAG: phage tail tape measure protein [Chloroflexota bacterium]